MTEWWEEGYLYAKANNVKSYYLKKGRKAKFIKKD